MYFLKYAKWLFLLICSLGFCLFGIINLAGNASLFMKGEKTPGTVSIGAADTPFLVFSDRFGSSYIKSFSHPFKGTLADKQPVTVIYNPKNPNEVTVNAFLYLWAIGLATFLIGLGGAIVSTISIDWGALISGTPSQPLQQQSSRQQNDSFSFQQESISSGASAQKQTNSLNLSPEVLANAFGAIKPLIDDPQVSDIIMAGPTSIFAKKGSKIIKAPITFPTEAKYDELIDRMLTVADNSFSIAKPIVDGMVTPQVRIHAVHKVLCEAGHYVTLRVSRYNSIRYPDLLKGTMAPKEVLAYLRAMLLTGHTILVSGEVGTGKTTLLRGLASTISDQESILVIEDTPEIKIEHPVVRYIRTRLSNMEGVGKISPGECIKAGMRMAMNRIIFGEIRDPEAAESFIDVCVSGHPGMSTIHARSASDAVARLELLLARQQIGVDRDALREQIGAAVQVIAYAQMCKETGQRRVTEVVEIRQGKDEPIDEQEIFRYSVSGKMPVWKVVNKSSYYDAELRDFEGGLYLSNYQDWLTLPEQR